jgi:hypothetical protein
MFNGKRNLKIIFKGEIIINEKNEKLILKAISIEAELNKRHQKRVELMKKKFESEKCLVISEFKKKIENLRRENVALDEELKQFNEFGITRTLKVKCEYCSEDFTSDMLFFYGELFFFIHDD